MGQLYYNAAVCVNVSCGGLALRRALKFSDFGVVDVTRQQIVSLEK